MMDKTENWQKYIESRLIEIRFLEKKQIRISFLLQSGKISIINLNSVDRFLALEMREINVIEEVQVYDGQDQNSEMESAVSLLVAGCTEKTKCDLMLIPVIDNIIAQIQEGNLVIFLVRAIYGVQMMGLVKSVEADF